MQPQDREQVQLIRRFAVMACVGSAGALALGAAALLLVACSADPSAERGGDAVTVRGDAAVTVRGDAAATEQNDQPGTVQNDTATCANCMDDCADCTELPPATERYLLADFSDGVLHDKEWLLEQPEGTLTPIFAPKGQGPDDEVSVAVGAGRNGGNALSVRSTNTSQGLPGFWIMQAEHVGYAANPGGPKKWLAQADAKFNALKLVIKFPAGFRQSNAAKRPDNWTAGKSLYPYHQNMHVGTYHANASTSSKEDSNWHYYFQLWLRHDLAQDDWMTIVVGVNPQHQRGDQLTPPPADFWGQLTRFYVDPVPYFSDSEIGYPVEMLVDSIELLYVEEPVWRDDSDGFTRSTFDDNVEKRWFEDAIADYHSK